MVSHARAANIAAGDAAEHAGFLFHGRQHLPLLGKRTHAVTASTLIRPRLLFT